MTEKLFKIGVNYSHINKHPAHLNEQGNEAAKLRWFRRYNRAFTNEQHTPNGILSLISGGYGVTAWHRKNRHRDNFICGQMVGVDFDNGVLTLGQLAKNPFVASHAAFVHTTASHTESHPKLRAVFLLDRPIKNAEKFGLLTKAMTAFFENSDKAASDPSRFFYGSEGCQSVFFGNVLTLENAAKMVVKPFKTAHNAKMERQRPNSPTARDGIPSGILGRHRDMLLAKIYDAPNGEKYHALRDVSRTFGGYVASGLYTLGEAEGWLRGAIEARRADVKSMSAAYKTISDGLDYGERSPLYFDLSIWIDDTPTPPKMPPKHVSNQWLQDAIGGRLAHLEGEIMALEPATTAWGAAANEYQKLQLKIELLEI